MLQPFFKDTTADLDATSQCLLRLINISKCQMHLRLVHRYFATSKVTKHSNTLDTPLQVEILVNITSSSHIS